MSPSPLRLYESPGTECELRRQFWRNLALPVEWVSRREEAHHGILVAPDKPIEPIESLKRMTRDILLLGYYDFLKIEDGILWPKAIAQRCLRPLILRRCPALDLRAWALVTGVQATSRLALESVFQLGFRQVRLVHGEGQNGEAQKIQTELQKFLFGFKITLQKRDDLTLQPNNGSILINVVDLTQDAPLRETLLYLNFLHRPGVILDLPFQAQDSDLISEARVSGFDAISGKEARGAWDYALLEELGLLPHLKLSAAAYAEAWEKL